MQASELILNSDGSIYHLGLFPDQIGDTIITVGDPQRVELVSRYFDKIIVRKSSREFVTHSGLIKNKSVSVISTGIGTDNIDIVLNEVDALANIDLSKREVKKKLKFLDIIRIGTSGSISKSIPVDSIIQSKYALGLDGLQEFYRYTKDETESLLFAEVRNLFEENKIDLPFYIAKSSLDLKLKGVAEGITVTAPGFYGPQIRNLRLQARFPNLVQILGKQQISKLHFTNIEMETAGIFTLANLMGHRAASLNVILANRVTGAFSSDPQKAIKSLISKVISHLRT